MYDILCSIAAGHKMAARILDNNTLTKLLQPRGSYVSSTLGSIIEYFKHQLTRSWNEDKAFT